MKTYCKNIIILLVLSQCVFTIDINQEPDPNNVGSVDQLNKVGDSPFPTNPMNDRALGYLLQGKVKNAISNYGNYISWDHHPAGLWGDWTYLPHVGFVAAIPGHDYSFKYLWSDCSSSMSQEAQVDNSLWCSTEAYDAWLSSADSVSYTHLTLPTKA